MVPQDIVYPILNQWQEWECASYALVNCLIRMKDIDPFKILEEMRPDFPKILTHKQAWAWLIKKWYIRDLVSYRYNPLLIDKIPVIVRLNGVDWAKTRIAPYHLTMGLKTTFAHYVCVCGKWKIVNSWGESFGDKWYFYFWEDQVKEFWMVSRILL